MMNNDINILIKKIQNNDEMAIAKLYEQIKPKSLSIARQYVNNSDAEDMFHTAFLKALNHINTFDSSKNFTSWFDVILVNTCKDFLAKKDTSATKNFSEIDETSENDKQFINSLQSTDKAFDPEGSLDSKALTEIMGNIISNLSEEQKEALILFYYKEMSVKDIAKEKGVSENTIKSRLNYARKKVGQDVEDYEKKNGIKLRSIGAIPLLLVFLHTSEGASLVASITSAASTLGAAATASATKTGIAKFLSTLYGKLITIIAGTAIVGGAVTGIVLMQPNDPIIYEVCTSIREDDDVKISNLIAYGSHNFLEKDSNGNIHTIDSTKNREKPKDFLQKDSQTEEALNVLFEHKNEIQEYSDKMTDYAITYSNEHPDATIQELHKDTKTKALDVTSYYPDTLTFNTQYGKMTMNVTKVLLIPRYMTITDHQKSYGKFRNAKTFPITVNGEKKDGRFDGFYISYYGKLVE